MQPTLALEATAFTKGQLLAPDQPQVALAGRSNVGKSSLLNALAGRKNLAKTGSAPGKTRSVNYYRVRPWDFLLADLPGYGHAKASREERRRWSTLTDWYIRNTPGLRGLLLLLDCRLPPQRSDLILVAFAEDRRLPLLPALTKADRCGRNDALLRQREWAALLRRAPLVVSSVSRLGLSTLWEELMTLAGRESRPGSRNTRSD
jgi:GTP-binding protein